MYLILSCTTYLSHHRFFFSFFLFRFRFSPRETQGRRLAWLVNWLVGIVFLCFSFFFVLGYGNGNRMN